MRVLVTGHLGYIGVVLTALLSGSGSDVAGLDTDFYRGCSIGRAGQVEQVRNIALDVRDVTPRDLDGIDAVVHLAALSNDPLGDIDPACTYDINLAGSLHLANAAREAGVKRFVLASSCSVYGAAGDAFLTEDASFNPVTPYGESKVRCEAALREMATDTFTPVFLRNATAYGYSPRLRLDLVVNDMAASAITTGRILVKSDGSPWRPLVHVEDIARAVQAALSAPSQAVHNEAFNIGSTTENFRVSELAEMVRAAVPGSVVEYAQGGGPDKRTYRVDFSKAATRLPGFAPKWTMHDGIADLVAHLREHALTQEDVDSDRYFRLRRIRTLLSSGALGTDLRWRVPGPAAAALLPARA